MKKSVSLRLFVPLLFSLQFFFFVPGLLVSQTVSLPVSHALTGAQTKLSGGAAEKLWQREEGNWEQDMQKKLNVSQVDFKLFLSLNTFAFVKEKRRFFIGISNGSIRTNNAGGFFDGMEKKFTSIYNNPLTPSELAEQNKTLPVVQATCNPSCDNISFQDSTLNAWSAFYAVNNSPNLANNNFLIQFVTGGLAGAVTQSAGPDPLITVGTDSTYQVTLETKGGGLDPIAGALIPITPPQGGLSAMIGDGINPGQGVGELEQTFSVSASNPVLTIQYAVVLENPTSHTYYEQPFFNMEVTDAFGNVISSGCGNYSVVSGPGLAGYKAIYYAPDFDTVYVRPWTTVFVPLYNYVGQCINVKFVAADCSLGGHFGYAYVAASCSNLGLNTSSASFCSGQKSITIMGSPGASAYTWSGPCVTGNLTQQVLTATCWGTYQVIETSSAGPTCIDTLHISIPTSTNGPPPIPSFTATEVCFGQSTTFTNTSNPDSSKVLFGWDFYNSGQVNDTARNPTWTFSQGGSYQVVLHETANGCGADTTVIVRVDSVPTLFQTPTVTPSTAMLCRCNGRVSILVAIDGSYHYVTNNFNADTIFAGGGPAGLSTANPADHTNFSFNGDSMIVSYSGLCPGNYSFYVFCPHPFPTNKCSAGESGATDTLKFTLNGAVISSAVGVAIDPASCNKNNGSATVTATATGVITGLTYHWNNGFTSDTLVGLASGTYTVTVTNSGGCTKTATVSIKDSTVLNTTLQQVSPKCFNGTDGSATVTPTAGTPPYVYTWSTSFSSTGGTGSNSTDNSLSSGSYVVTITDATGCSATTAVTITQPPQLSMTSVISPTGCSTPDGIATVSPKGGTPGYVCSWNSGVSTTTLGGLAAGTYTVTVTDVNNCSATSTVVVTQRIPPVVDSITSSLNNKPFCMPGNDSVCVLFIGHVTSALPFSEIWHFGNGDSSTVAAPTFCFKNTGVYTVSLSCKDTAGCSTVKTMPNMISIFPKPYAGFTFNPWPAQAGQPVNFVNQSTIATSYLWNFSDPRSGSDSVSTLTNPQHTFQDTGRYCMMLTSSTAQCSNVYPICIDVVHTLCILNSDSIPNVFTPNGDNINDFFLMKSNGMTGLTCEVFDRWGIKVHTFNALESSWNGKLPNGSEAPAGTYFYTVSGTCIDGQKKVAHGFVQLLK